MLTALSSTKPQGSITVSSLIPYYLLISQTYAVVKSDIDERITQLNNSGDVNNFLTKPLSFFRYLLFLDFGEKIIRFIYLFPPLILTLLTSGSNYNLPLFFLGLPISYFVSFLLGYLTGLISFWIDEAWAFSNVRFVLIQLLGGVILPYSLFPETLNRIIKFTPFPYAVSLSTRLTQNNAGLQEVLFAAIWAVALYLVVKLVEKKAILKYSHTGG